MSQLTLKSVLLAVWVAGALAFGRLPDASVTTEAVSTNKDGPWFCHDLDCPLFTVTERYQAGTIELRAYTTSTWASTKVTDVSYDAAVRTGFYRLFNYISGANEGQHKIEMTAPVKVRCVAGAGPFCESTFIVSFMVPFELQAAPPAPNAEEVYIETLEAANYFVSSYGGWTSDSTVIQHALDLLTSLDDLKLAYESSYFLSAGYDAPFRLLNRHNEIWVEAAATPSA